MPILTNSSGTATAPTLTANGIGGTFTVTASVSTLSVTFTLTNQAYNYLGASSVIVGNAAGSGSVLLLSTGGLDRQQQRLLVAVIARAAPAAPGMR